MKRLNGIAIGCISGGLLLTACSRNSDLVAIKCTQQTETLLSSILIGSEPTLRERSYERIMNYLINYKTRQVKRWLNKEGAPLVNLEGVSFKPDFITWKFYTGSTTPSPDVKEDLISLNRETLAISGKKLEESYERAGSIRSFIAFTGTCEKTDIPWDKIKSKQI